MNMDQSEQHSGQCCRGNNHSFGGQRQGLVTIVFIFLALFLLALSIKTFKEIGYVGGGIAETNAISVSGSGEAIAVPDTAEFTFSVSQEGDTAVEVRDAATRSIDDALQALKDHSVNESDIKTIAYSLQPRYEYRPETCVRFPCERTRVQNGYTLDQTVLVKVRDLDRAGEVIEAVTNAGVQTVGGLSFTIADEDKPKEEARKMAIDNARSKADKLAEDLGVSVVRIIGFSEDGDYPRPYYAATMEAGIGGDAALAKTTPSVPAGENSVTSQVTITYEIR